MSSNLPTDPQINPDAPLRNIAKHVDREGLVAVLWVVFSIATIFFILRMSVRWRQNRSFLSDDYWMIWTWLCYLTMCIVQMEQMNSLWFTVFLQAGRIAPTQKAMTEMEQLARWQFPIIKLFWTTLWSVKASFLAVFYRMVQPYDIYRRVWYGVAAFTLLAYIGTVLSSILTCDLPGDYFVAGKCTSPRELWHQRFNVIFSSALDITTDLMIMSLPLALVPILTLDKRKKMGLIVIFSVSFFVISIAIVRMTQVMRPNGDEQVDLIGLALWGAVEPGVAVIVGSLPPLKAFLSRRVKNYTNKRSGLRLSAENNELPGESSRTRNSNNAVVLDAVPWKADDETIIRKFDLQQGSDSYKLEDDFPKMLKIKYNTWGLRL